MGALHEGAVLAEEDHIMTDLKDLTGLVAQVQGLMNGYLKLRDEKVQLEAELSTRREDIRRLEKLVASQNAEIDKLKAK
jgi:chromosome segregation ATPase